MVAIFKKIKCSQNNRKHLFNSSLINRNSMYHDITAQVKHSRFVQNYWVIFIDRQFFKSS